MKNKFKRFGTLLLTAAAISVITISLTSCGDQKTTVEKTTVEYDVVIVGGGAAGLAAAIEAAEAGVSVALMEKMPMLGGSTLLSGGIVYGTGFTMQKEASVDDSVDALVQYWSDRADGLNDKDFLRFVAERSGATIDWLIDLGAEMNGPAPAGTSPVPRSVTSTTRGSGLIQPLRARADELGVDIMLETSATSLVTTDGAVVGVIAKDTENNETQYSAGAVVLATGGFDRNPQLVSEYASVAEGHMTFVGSGNTGDAITMTRDLNVDIVGHGGVIGFRAVEGESSYTTDVCSLMWMPYLYVNKDGHRFVNETIDYPIFHQELIEQEDQVSYLIFDGNTYVDTLDKAVEKGVAFTGDTLNEVANAAGINPKGLANTVKSYNAMIAAGEDTDFGKPLAGLPPINTPTYYALKVVPATLGTMSGLKVDLDTRVITKSGTAVPGLFAAGEVANGSFFNQVYPASGTSIQMSFTFGRVAGTNAAAYASAR